jgi:hypothetical protein
MRNKNIILMDNGKSNIHSKARSMRIKVGMTKDKAEGMEKGKARTLIQAG